MLMKLLYFAALAGQISRKREQEPWSPEENQPCQSFGMPGIGPQPNRTGACRLCVIAVSVDVDSKVNPEQPDFDFDDL